MTGHQKPGKGKTMHSRNDMHTHSHDVLQSGEEIAAPAKAEKNSRDTTGAARSDIWCPATLWVVRLKETGNGGGAGKGRLTE
jgi:hypothetical protein